MKQVSDELRREGQHLSLIENTCEHSDCIS